MPASRTRRRLLGRLAAGVGLTLSALALPSVAPSAHAAPGDCGFTGPTQTFIAGNGAWNVAANWDTNTIPAGGQICIPNGRVATLGDYGTLVGSFYSQTLRIYGTLRASTALGAGTSTYGSSTVHNYGRIEVTAGTTFTMGNYDSFVYNHPGAVINVASTGTLNVTRDLHNVGGQINLNGGGTMNVGGAAALFEQGSEGATQGTVVNGTVNVGSGTINLTGSGAASIRFHTNGYLQGTVSAAQTVAYTCDTYTSGMSIAGDVTNNGTINFTPRVGACGTYLSIPTGLTLTNNGTINAGSANAWITGAGTVVNAPSGVVNVDESFITTISNWMNQGAIVVDADRQFGIGDSLFTMQSGTITNNGTIRVDRSSGSYGYFAIVRVVDGNLVGNPISLYASHVELPGTGAVAFNVLKDGYADLRADSGPTVIHPSQSFIVDGQLASSYPGAGATDVINQGTITLTGIAASAGSTLGSAGTAAITNQGSIILTARESAAGPYNYIVQPLVNEVGGVVRNIGNGRPCYIQASFTNRGLFQLDPGPQNCIVAFPHFESTSVFRTSSTAAGAGQMVGIQNDSSLGGTVDVVTVAPAPALGQELAIATPASGRKVGGNFAGVTGAISSSLGYELAYDEPSGHQVKLKVIAGSFSTGTSYAPLVPARLLETRAGSGLGTTDGQASGGGAAAAGSVTELQVTGRAGIPSNAAAAVLNITVTGARGPGFLTVFPCGSARPNAASLNYETGSTIPNAVIAKIGAGGKVCIYTLAGTDLIADVNGFYPAGASYTALVPARLLETRTGPGLGTVDGQANGGGAAAAGSVTELQVTGRAGIPGDAAAVALNVTATGAQGSGFVTVFPCGSSRPNAANLNYVVGSTVPNAVIAKIGTGGKVCLFTLAGTDLIVDVNGFYPAGASYTALVPARLLETRSGPGLETVDGQSSGGGAAAAGSVTELQVTGRAGVPVGAAAGAVVLNVTVTGARGAGFVTVFPCGSPRPNAANLNYVLGSTIPNAVIAKVGDGGKVCIYTLAGTDLIADVNGWFAAS